MVTTDGHKVITEERHGITKENNGAMEEKEWYNGR